MRTLTLTQLISQARSRADMLRSNFVSTAEWTDFVNAGVAELWQELVAAFGEEYFLLFHSFSTVADTVEYDLPGTFWKLRGLEVQIGSQWVPVPRFGMPARLQYQSIPAQITGANRSNLKYALWGSRLKLIPTPDAAYSLRAIYVPRPDRLATLTCAAASVTYGTCNFNVAQHGLRADQLVRPAAGTESGAALPTGLRADTDYYAIIVDGDNFQLAASPAGEGTATAVTLTDAGTGTHTIDGVLDGVAGWEEWPILSAAIRALEKEESDVAELKNDLYGVPGDPERPGVKGRVRIAAKTRDAAEPLRIVNVYVPDGDADPLLGEY